MFSHFAIATENTHCYRATRLRWGSMPKYPGREWNGDWNLTDDQAWILFFGLFFHKSVFWSPSCEAVRLLPSEEHFPSLHNRIRPASPAEVLGLGPHHSLGQMGCWMKGNEGNAPRKARPGAGGPAAAGTLAQLSCAQLFPASQAV